MLKEIHEQPEAMKDTVLPRMSKGLPDLSEDEIPDSLFLSCSQIHIVACGTAMHAGMVAKSIMEPLLRIPVTVTIASEFRYQQPLIDGDTLVIVISQSGETIDTIAAMDLAQSYGSKTLAIVNVKGSTIAREADNVLYTLAGPEIAVATTKAYSAQLMAMYALAVQLALVRGKLTEDEYTGYIEELATLPDKIARVLEDKGRIQWFAAKFANARDIFFLGRGADYAASLEGQPENEGDQLYPQRGLRRGGAEARHHQPGGGQHPGDRRAYPEQSVRENHQQYGGV